MGHWSRALGASLVVLSFNASTLAAEQRGESPAKDPSPSADPMPTLRFSKIDLFQPRFFATGEFQLVRLLGKDRELVRIEKVFGHGAAAEAQAKETYQAAIASAKAGDAPVILRRVFTHYRCPKRKFDSTPSPDEINNDTDSGPASDLECDALKINYTLPPDPTTEVDEVDCRIGVDVDVLVVGRRVKAIRWELEPMRPDSENPPLIRLLDVAADRDGQLVRGITFDDDNMHPRERGESANPILEKIDIFEGANTDARGQGVTWSRADGRRRLPKSLYYSVVAQYWSKNLNRYVFCKPYDPLVYNKGN